MHGRRWWGGVWRWWWWFWLIIWGMLVIRSGHYTNTTLLLTHDTHPLFHRYGKPANDGIQWPPTAEGKAIALRQQARHMLDDLAAVANAYALLLQSTSVAMQEAVRSGMSARDDQDYTADSTNGAHGDNASAKTSTTTSNAATPRPLGASAAQSRASFGSVALTDDETAGDGGMLDELAAWCVQLEETRAKGVDAARSRLLDAVRALLHVLLFESRGVADPKQSG